VIVKKRYTEDKILFHLPITLNRVSKKIDSPRLFNESINQAFSKNIDDIAVIGIDRGEKHLLYYSLINSKGEIIEQKSLNEVNGIPYYRLLRDAERKRLEDRRSWNSARKIKDLKKGYVGHVVKELVDLVIKHNAVIVFEDLNMRFKQIRGGVDRSVYMQIEKALLNKLNYLSFKNRKPSEIGGIANGYQLAPLIKKESDKRKQAGIVLYTTAEYTSTTDPVTGFRKNIYLSSGTKQKDVSDIIGKFDAIGWDDKLQSYYFVYEPKNFESKTNKKKEDYVGKPWCVYADAPRVKREKNKESGIWEYELVNPNDMLRSLFSVWGFTQLEGDIKEQILEMEQEGLLSGKKQFDGKERTFIASLVYIFNLILALRNSFAKKLLINKKTGEVNEIGDDIDFIASPVAPFFSTYAKSDKYGELSPLNLAGLDQKIIGEKKAEIKEEFNGDANGAYNIARKGLLMLQKIHDDPQKPDLYISINEWDKFAQSQNKLD
jgi:CRISPR-associated protein Cpf1